MTGILVGYLLDISLAAAGIPVFLCALFLAAGIFLCKDARPLFLLAAFALGVLFCGAEQSKLDAYPVADNTYVTLEGRVQGAATPREDDRYRFQLSVDTVDGAAVDPVPVYVYGEGDLPSAGSRVEVFGKSFSSSGYGNANAFDYGEYLRRQGIAGSVSTYYSGRVTELEAGPSFAPGRITEWLRASLDEAASCLTDRQKMLVYGVFLGDKTGMSYNERNVLGITGLLHAFAVSGMHVGYIALFAGSVAGTSYQRRDLRFVLTLFALLLYVGLTGARPSVCRAALMIGLMLFARQTDERYDTVTSLSFAALLSLVWHPMWLFDAGFQMSFGAVMGIYLFYGPILACFPKKIYGIGQGFAVALSATLPLIPLSAFYFYRVSWIGWLISPLAVSMAGLTVILCFMGLVVAIFAPVIAGTFLLAAAYVMEVLYWLAELLSKLPFAASPTGALPLWSLLLFYILLLTVFHWKKLRFRLRMGICLVLLPVAFCLLPLLGNTHGLPSDAEGEVVFLDVGQGDSALVITKEGYTLLIDGGGSVKEDSVGENILLPYLQSRRITALDAVISSHPDTDHTEGLVTLVDHMEIGAVYYAAAAEENDLQLALLASADARDITSIPLAAGDTVTFGENAAVTVIGPAADAAAEDGNDTSLVMMLELCDTELLFTGDASGDILAAYTGEADLSADIVKLPHHGSKTGYDEVFFAETEADHVIFSVGKGNSYGHPHQNVVEYWKDRAEIWRTDLMGAVTVLISEDGYEIRSERESNAESGT